MKKASVASILLCLTLSTTSKLVASWANSDYVENKNDGEATDSSQQQDHRSLFNWFLNFHKDDDEIDGVGDADEAPTMKKPYGKGTWQPMKMIHHRGTTMKKGKGKSNGKGKGTAYFRMMYASSWSYHSPSYYLDDDDDEEDVVNDLNYGGGSVFTGFGPPPSVPPKEGFRPWLFVKGKKMEPMVKGHKGAKGWYKGKGYPNMKMSKGGYATPAWVRFSAADSIRFCLHK